MLAISHLLVYKRDMLGVVIIERFFMLSRLILAVVVAVVVTLACFLLGSILISLSVAIAVTIGDWLKQYGAVLGVLAGLWQFFSGGFSFPSRA